MACTFLYYFPSLSFLSYLILPITHYILLIIRPIRSVVTHLLLMFSSFPSYPPITSPSLIQPVVLLPLISPLVAYISSQYSSCRDQLDLSGLLQKYTFVLRPQTSSWTHHSSSSSSLRPPSSFFRSSHSVTLTPQILDQMEGLQCWTQ